VSEVTAAGRREGARGRTPVRPAARATAADPVIGLVRCDQSLKVIDVEMAVCRLLARRRSELVGQSFLSVVEEEKVNKFAMLTQRLTARGLEAASVEVNLVGRSGIERPVQATVAFLPPLAEQVDDSGRWPDGSFLISILPRSHTQMNAERIEATARPLAERAPDLITRYRLWPERGFDFVSPSSEEVLGYPPSAFYANPDLFHMLVDDPAELNQLFKLYEGRWEPHEPLMLHLVHRDERVRVLELRTTCVRDGEGEALAIESIGRDITERADERLRLSTTAAITRLLYELAPTDLDTASPAEVLQAAVDAVCTHLRWPVGDAFLLDADPGYLSSVAWHATDPRRFASLRAADAAERWPLESDPVADALILAEPSVTELPGRLDNERARRAAACGLSLAITLPVPVDGGIGAALEFFPERSAPPSDAIIDGLREVAIEVGRALMRSNRAVTLRQIDQARQEFVERAAHELRGPVGSIALMASGLAREAHLSDQERLASSLESLAAQAERIQTMATHLLELSQLDEGRLEMHLGPQRVADAAQAALAGVAHDTQKTVTINAPADLAVYADQLLLDEILANLLANAHRHGGRCIEVEARRDGDVVEITVSDDGSGVPPELLSRLFEPMTLRRVTSEHGGLGLALVRKMAVAMGGGAHYQPNLPTGARFVVVLPAA
jgi:signal transduction histidine kinase/PAS domain-containing protein